MNLVFSLIVGVLDWPKPGVVFKDTTPLLVSPEGFRQAADAIVASVPEAIDVVVRMETRGSIFVTPVTLALGAGFVPIRKPGKLPCPMLSESFDLEYGTTTLTMHADAPAMRVRVLVVDDVLAAGGTVAATVALLKRLGAEFVHVSVLLELTALDGRERPADQRINSYSAVLTS